MAGMMPRGLCSMTCWWPAGRVGWEKNVSVGRCCGGRKRQGKGHGGGGGGVDAQAQARGRGLAQNADSASGGTFCPEIPHTLLPSTAPALPTLAPWEAWNPGSFSGQKDPMTSHVPPWQPTVRSQVALPSRTGRGGGAAGRAGGGWRSVLSPGTRSRLFQAHLLQK